MATNNKEILDLTSEDHILRDLLTLTIILTMIGAVCVYIAPGITELGNNIIPTRHTPLQESSDTPMMNNSLIIEFPGTPKPTEIESLISNLTWANPANKGQYAYSPDKVDEVHVCANMAVEQAEWIIENYEYDVGIVMLYNRYIGDNHVQTWVDVNGTRYIIDSTSNYYWTEEDHVAHWKDRYGIQYTNVEKGREHVKENNEMLNNKDEPQLPPVDPIVDITIIGNMDIVVGEKTKFLIRVETNINTPYKLNVTIDGNIIYHGECQQYDRMIILPITYVFITPGTHTISADIIFDHGDYKSSDEITRTIVDNI